MQCAGAAERDQREISRIITLADRNKPTASAILALATLRIESAASSGVRPKGFAIRSAIAFSARSRCSLIAPPASEVPRRPSMTLASEFVGSRAALIVADRSRPRASRLRTIPQGTALINPRQRTAACTDCQHFYAGKADRITVLNVPILGDRQHAFVAKANVGARAAHVEADRVLKAGELSDEAARNRPRGNARARESGRELLRNFDVITPPPE